MKMKCENIVTCGNYNCELNCEGACIRTVVALDGAGKCVMCKPKPKPVPKDTAVAPNKSKIAFDMETSK